MDFFGAGVALGYGVALFDKAKVPQSEDLVKQVKNISSISEIVYSDGSVIASIESDLLRTSVSSEEIFLTCLTKSSDWGTLALSNKATP